MKRPLLPRPLLVGTLVASLLVPLALAAQDGSRGGGERSGQRERPGDREHGDDDDSPLAQAMKTVQRSMRTLGRSLQSPDGHDRAIEAIGGMEQGLLAAFQQEPPTPPDMTDAMDKVRRRIAFQRKILSTLDTTLQLEEAVRTGKDDAVRGLFQTLRQDKEDGHDTFQVDDDDDEHHHR